MNEFLGRLPDPGELWPFLAILALVATIWWGAGFYLERKARYAAGKQFVKPLVMMLLGLFLLVVLILALPTSEETRNQLLGLVGLAVSAVIAFSSTSFIGNAMAGLMLRSINSFRGGDFIRVESWFGRVSERGLFHTEIQTEHRDLVSLPNLYLVTHPVVVVRSSGTIVHAEVSLGYDVPRSEIEAALIVAAEEVGLKDAYVHILELKDFSIVYRVGGLLNEVKDLISVRSILRKKMLDCLHERGVEIVSPAFMNQRQVPAERVFIPSEQAGASRHGPIAEVLPEAVFDKADEAEDREKVAYRLGLIKKELESMGAASGDEAQAKKRQELDAQRQRLEATLAHLNRNRDT